MSRLFVAVWPPEDVLDAIAALPRPEVTGIRWTSPQQWHVTLRFLGECDEALASAALDQVDGEGAIATMGPSTDRFGHRILHVPVHGLDRIAVAVAAAFAGVGRDPEERAFRGHVTLARAATQGRRGPDLKPLCGVPVSASWEVDEIALVRSTPTGGAHRYDTIATRALR